MIPKVFVQDNQEVKSDSSNNIRSFLVIALHDPDESLKFILGIAGVYINLRINEMNKVKYEWTNEADFVFAKKDPRVEVPYVGPHLRCLMLHQRFQSLMYMKCIIYKTWK